MRVGSRCDDGQWAEGASRALRYTRSAWWARRKRTIADYYRTLRYGAQRAA